MYDLLVLGEINADLILSGDVRPTWGQVEKLIDDAALTLGGSSSITAAGAARLGLRVAFMGLVGDDMFGRFCLAALEERGVDTRHVIVDPRRRTGLTVVLQQPDDRAMLTFAGTIAELGADMVPPALLAQARHVHVGAYFLQDALRPGLPGLFAHARRAGATTSVDTNWDPSGRWGGMAELLAETDLLLPNEAEAAAIAGALAGRPLALGEAIDLLAARVPTVAVKRGGEGATVARGPARDHAPPLAVQFVDAVGAGDSFNAGFIYGMLQGWPAARALRLAAACGSLSTRAAGGTAAQPTADEALHMLQGA